VRDEAPGVDRAAVERAVLERFAPRAAVQATQEDTRTLLLARELLDQHRIS
jgi:hypothetical protein